MNHHGGAEAGLVGEDAPLHAPFDCELDAVADHAAGSSLDAEGALEDGGEYRSDMADVDKEDRDGSDHIQNHHEGHNLLCHCGNPLQSADYNQAYQDHDHQAGNPAGHTEYGVHVSGDGVDLGHVTDAEGSHQAEEGEQACQDEADGFAAFFGAQAVPQVVHRAAGPLAFGVLAAVEDAQHVFGIVGHHAQEGHDPHPEHGAGAAGQDRAGHAHDIAGAHRRGQGGAKALELGNTLVLGMGGNVLVMEHSADGLLHPVTEVAHLENLGQHSHQDSDEGKQCQGRHTPDDTVYGIVHVRHGIDESAAGFFGQRRCRHRKAPDQNACHSRDLLHILPCLSSVYGKASPSGMPEDALVSCRKVYNLYFWPVNSSDPPEH